MNLPEEKPNTGQAVKPSSIAAFFLLLLVVLGLAAFVYLKSQNVDLKNINLRELINSSLGAPAKSGKSESGLSEDKPSVIGYDLKEHPSFALYRDLLIKCTNDYIRALDKNGEEQWAVQISISSPIIKTNGVDLLVADKGGKDIYLIVGKEVKWRKKLDFNIINADIGESGYISVVHEAKGYKGAVSVYGIEGNKFFTRYIGENFPISAKAAPSGKFVIINDVDASGISTNTNIEFVDMQGKPFAKIVKQGILPYMAFLNGEALMAAGDSSVILFDKNGNEKWTQDYKKAKIYSVDVVLGKYAVIAADVEAKAGAAGNQSVEVRIVNSDGKQVSTYAPGDGVVNIAAYGNVIAVNTGREVHFINTKGKLIKKCESKSDIISVRFLSKQEAAVFNKGNILIVKLG